MDTPPTDAPNRDRLLSLFTAMHFHEAMAAITEQPQKQFHLNRSVELALELLTLCNHSIISLGREAQKIQQALEKLDEPEEVVLCLN